MAVIVGGLIVLAVLLVLNVDRLRRLGRIWRLRQWRGRWHHDHTLRTERLVLRPPRPDDRTAFLATIDDEVRRWQGYDDEAVERHRRTFDARAARRPETCAAELVVCEDGAVIGHWMLAPSRSDRTKLESGWWLGAAGRGRGLGREALATVLDYAHQHLGVAVVRMGTAASNVVARRQIEAVGGVVVEESPHRLPDGSTVDGVWYEHRADDAAMADRRAAGAAPCWLNRA